MGEKISASVAAFFGDDRNIAIIESMKRLGLKLSNPDYAGPGSASALPFDGLTFVLTGTLPSPRKEVEEFIEKNGGHAASAVSANTDYLVAGEDAGSKLEKAERLGVRKISYEELVRMAEKKAVQERLF